MRRASDGWRGRIIGYKFLIDGVFLLTSIRNYVAEHIKSLSQLNILKSRNGLVCTPGTGQFRGHSLISTEDDGITFIRPCKRFTVHIHIPTSPIHCVIRRIIGKIWSFHLLD